MTDQKISRSRLPRQLAALQRRREQIDHAILALEELDRVRRSRSGEVADYLATLCTVGAGVGRAA